MQMQRGDVVTVAAAGDYGKPRPAVIVQTNAFPENHASVVVCQLTSELVDAPDFRVTIEPKPENGLRLKWQVMADKPVNIRRERIGEKIGRLGTQDLARLGIALAFVLGLADRNNTFVLGRSSFVGSLKCVI
jgi:mRNA interferase MazF